MSVCEIKLLGHYRCKHFRFSKRSTAAFCPRDHRCPVCGSSFSDGVAYLSAGALLLSDDGQDSIDSDKLQAFLHVGVHVTDSEMRDSADIPIVMDLRGGQFDLSWCSVACMRNGLLDVLRNWRLCGYRYRWQIFSRNQSQERGSRARHIRSDLHEVSPERWGSNPRR